MVYHILKRKPEKILTILPDSYYKTKLIRKQILICDDASYSGFQIKYDVLIGNIDRYNFFRQDIQTNFDIHFVIPFMTEISKKRINGHLKFDNSYNFYDTFKIDIPEIPNIEPKPLLYFDHKIPDNLSTYSNFFNTGTDLPNDSEGCLGYDFYYEDNSLLKSCKIDNENDCDDYCEAYQCPIIPYKKKYSQNNNNYSIQILTPKEFLQRFGEGKKKQKGKSQSVRGGLKSGGKSKKK